VSYVHPQNDWVRRATERALSLLKNAIEFYSRAPPYIDDERLKPMYNHNERLAEAICQSACMVILYYPAYLESPYCRRELVAMKRMEARRREHVGSGAWGYSMFVPFVIRGTATSLPRFAHENSLWFDYSAQSLADHDISNESAVREKIFKLAESITELHSVLSKSRQQTQVDCRGFALPTEEEADLEIGEIPIVQSRFPGR
jgi:hypothetical protein